MVAGAARALRMCRTSGSRRSHPGRPRRPRGRGRSPAPTQNRVVQPASIGDALARAAHGRAHDASIAGRGAERRATLGGEHLIGSNHPAIALGQDAGRAAAAAVEPVRPDLALGRFDEGVEAVGNCDLAAPFGPHGAQQQGSPLAEGKVGACIGRHGGRRGRGRGRGRRWGWRGRRRRRKRRRGWRCHARAKGGRGARADVDRGVPRTRVVPITRTVARSWVVAGSELGERARPAAGHHALTGAAYGCAHNACVALGQARRGALGGGSHVAIGPVARDIAAPRVDAVGAGRAPGRAFERVRLADGKVAGAVAGRVDIGRVTLFFRD